MTRLTITSTLILIGLASCVTVPLASYSQDKQAKSLTAPDDSGRVYCYRPHTWGTPAIALTLEVDGEHVADLPADTFAYYDLSPGSHTFASTLNAFNRTSFEIEVHPGQVYFLRQTVGLGVHFTSVTKTQAIPELYSCHLLKALANPRVNALPLLYPRIEIPRRPSASPRPNSSATARTPVLPEPPTTPIEPKTIETRRVRLGTGFAISDQGHILTAYHVVAGRDRLGVQFENDEWLDAKLLTHSKKLDIALLKIEESTKQHLSLCGLGTSAQGHKIFTIGFPVTSILGTRSKYTEGVITSKTGVADEASLLQVTVPVQPGNSGGALVGTDGTVVGIVTSTAAVGTFFKTTGALPQNVSWGVNADYVRAFLGGVDGLELGGDVIDASRNQDEQIAHVRRSTCAVGMVEK